MSNKHQIEPLLLAVDLKTRIPTSEVPHHLIGAQGLSCGRNLVPRKPFRGPSRLFFESLWAQRASPLLWGGFPRKPRNTTAYLLWFQKPHWGPREVSGIGSGLEGLL